MTTPRRNYPKSVYAVAGAGELALEQIRKLPEAANKLRGRFEAELRQLDVANVRGRVQRDVNRIPTQVQSEYGVLRERVKTDMDALSDRVRAEVKHLRGRLVDVRRKGTAEVRVDAERFRDNAQDTVNDLVETAQHQFKVAGKQVVRLYEGLADRGEKMLGNGKPRAVKAAGKATPSRSTQSKSVQKSAQSRSAQSRSGGGRAGGSKAGKSS